MNEIRIVIYRFLIFFLSVLTVACVSPIASMPPDSTLPVATHDQVSVPYKFELGTMSVTPEEIEAGQPAQVRVVIGNTGSRQNAYVGTLYVDGQEYTRQAITLNPGNSGILTFHVSNLGAGTHLLTLGSSSASLKVYTIEKYQIVNTYIELPRYTRVEYTPIPPEPHITADTFSSPVSPFFIRQINFRYPYPQTFRILDANNSLIYTADIAYAATAFVPDIEVDGDFTVELQTGQPVFDIRSEYFGESSFLLVVAFFWPRVSTIDGFQKRYIP